MPKTILEKYPWLKKVAAENQQTKIDNIIQSNSPLEAYNYCCNKQQRISELENIILQSRIPTFLRCYASYVIKGRWKESEKYIIVNPQNAALYAMDVIKGRWRDAERYIAQDPTAAIVYAQEVLKGRFRMAEKMLNESGIYKQQYWYGVRSCYFEKLVGCIIKTGGIFKNAIGI